MIKPELKAREEVSLLVELVPPEEPPTVVLVGVVVRVVLVLRVVVVAVIPAAAPARDIQHPGAPVAVVAAITLELIKQTPKELTE
jgi:hypothetical protein